jgi:hypothetical protein
MLKSCSVPDCKGDALDADDAGAQGLGVLDTFIQGEPFAVIGNRTMYKAPQLEHNIVTPTTSWNDLKASLREESASRRSRMIFLHYTSAGQNSVELIFTTLRSRLARSKALVCCDTVAPNNSVVVFFRKEDGIGLPDWNIAGFIPVVYSVSRGNVITHQRYLHALSTCLIEVWSDMLVVPSNKDEASFEQVVAATKNMSETDFLTLKGTILMKDPKMRTPADCGILRAFAPLKSSDRNVLPLMIHRWCGVQLNRGAMCRSAVSC